MPKALINSWPLFTGIMIIMIGNGLQGTLLGVRAVMEGFSVSTTGLIMSMYYLGFLIGCRSSPKLVANVGHIRVFAAMASLASTTVLIQAVFIEPLIWMVARLISGVCFAGLYIVVESWLNGLVTNKIRGKVLSLYLIINYLGLMLGQLLMNLANPKGIELFILSSVLISLALLPLSLSRRTEPKLEESKHIKINTLYQASPLGLIGVCLSGLTYGTLFTLTPVYATSSGMSVSSLSLLMSVMIMGAMLIQYPIGLLSDILDRRKIIILCSFIAFILSLVCYASSEGSFLYFLIAAFFFWAFGSPLYSLSASHLYDHLETNEIVAASGTIILFNGAGAFIGPFLISLAITYLGDNLYFPMLGLIFLIMASLGFVRTFMTKSIPVDDQSHFIAMPAPTRSSHIVARLTKEDILQKGSNDK